MSEKGPKDGKIRACLPLVFAALTLTNGCGRPEQAAPAMRSPTVEVATAVQKDVPAYSEWIATLNGYVNAQIQPQVTGYIVRQNYGEGSFVRKGDVLFEIDARPFQAALDQAKAQLAQAQAQLGAATLNVKRDIPEAKEHAIPQSQLDNDTQAQLAAKASVAAGEAAVETAELNLSYTKVRSLVDGVAGIAQVQVGNLVNPSTVLTAVSAVNPIKVYFPVNSSDYSRLTGHGQRNGLARLASVPLELVLADGKSYDRKGRILFADRQVDPRTGTIQLVGEFPNPANVLRPGETVTVRALTQIQKNAVIIPQRAVTELQGGYQVAVVGPDNKVHIRSVQVGDRVGTMWIIAAGVKTGERVVAEGTEKVREGATVTPAPYAGGVS